MAKPAYTKQQIIDIIEESGADPQLAGISDREALEFIESLLERLNRMADDLRVELNMLT